MTSFKKMQNIPQSWRHRPKATNTKLNFFSSYSTRLHETLEGLNSSLAQSAVELWLAKLCRERVDHTFPATSWFLSKMEILSHHFGTIHARKSTKGSNDACDSLVSKKSLGQKMAVFFRVQSTRLADPFEPLNSSLAQSSEELGRW